MCFLLAFKGHLQRCPFALPSFGSGFRVQGGGFAAFFIGAMPQSAFLVTSHSCYTREGIVSHAWHVILRLSPHLFWLGLFTHRAFSLRSGCRYGGAEGFSSGRYVACFGTIGVIYDTSRPLEKGRAEGAGWIHEAV